MVPYKAKKVSIIVPVFNEEKTLELLLRKVARVRLLGLKKEILVVDDGSTDRTGQILRKVRIPGMKVLRHERNRGKGAALRTAFPQTTGDIVLIQDADLEYDPADYVSLMGPILEGAADVVYGSRFMGVHRAFLFLHFVGNKFLTLTTNLLYNTTLTDMETCYKVFKGDVIRSIPLRSNRFEIEPEMTAKVLKRGHKLYEVPISFRGRGFEEGKKITWRDGFSALWTLFIYRFVD